MKYLQHIVLVRKEDRVHIARLLKKRQKRYDRYKLHRRILQPARPVAHVCFSFYAVRIALLLPALQSDYTDPIPPVLSHKLGLDSNQRERQDWDC